MNEEAQRIIFDRAQIQQTVERLGGEIDLWLKGTQTKGLNLICVLEGAKPFARDLSRTLRKTLPELALHIHEIRIKGTDGTSLLKDRQVQTAFPTAQILGSHPLLIVDDLVDSGLTLKLLKKELETVTAMPVKTAALIRKFGEGSGPVDFIGLELGLDLKELAAKGLKDHWLFGYGMDLDGRQRELDHIGALAIPLGTESPNGSNDRSVAM